MRFSLVPVRLGRRPAAGLGLAMLALGLGSARGTPANKSALAAHYGRFLTKELSACTTCHQLSAQKNPQTLADFPHNPFGQRLRELAQGWRAEPDLERRVVLAAREDSDGDGVANEVELLLGHNPGDAQNSPDPAELRQWDRRREEFALWLAEYPWRPFQRVRRPHIPQTSRPGWNRNPIDAFLAAGHAARGLIPRPEASRSVLLRRVHLDLIGLNPTPAEWRAFEADPSPDAYEKVVDRLLADPRHGERWARHWMDVWRYSDWAGWTDGGQVRDSKPHIWRWRDWIVESLNQDKGYDRMILEMLAADEWAPEDTNALRATGLLVRNYKMLSREQWMEDTVKHTAQAFLGLTLGCAKCHDHMTDPISQQEYYEVRAIFDPHQVRTDRVPGQIDAGKDGLVRAFDAMTNLTTYVLTRGDERHPDTNRLARPGVPRVLGGHYAARTVSLPRAAALPDQRAFVIEDTVAASSVAVAEARAALAQAGPKTPAPEAKHRERQLALEFAEARHAALLAVLRAESLEDSGEKEGERWNDAARTATRRQREASVAEATWKLHQARVAEAEAQAKADAASRGTNAGAKASKELEAAKKKFAEAAQARVEAEKAVRAKPGTAFQPRATERYPDQSTGRRLALAEWIAHRDNPLTARVAVNHIWLRHFGQGIVATPADFGRNGRAPSHPQLLDWLAAEFMARGWSMKALHRWIVTSHAYRMASTPDVDNAAIDPDNVYLWRMNSRRLEAEAVRDNLLYAAGDLEATRGGPDIDHRQGLTSKRRSLYLRVAAEKEVEFLRIFDGPSVTECYQRRPSVVPQQALALANSDLTRRAAQSLAQALAGTAGPGDDRFIEEAFLRVLSRRATADEVKLCRDFLEGRVRARGREELLAVLFNHSDFVTVR